MDDIKLNTNNEHDIVSLIHLTRIYSNDITTELPDGNIADVQDSYKSTGIPQADGSCEEPHPDTYRR